MLLKLNFVILLFTSDVDRTASMEETIVPFLTDKKFCIKYFPDTQPLRTMIEAFCGSVVEDIKQCDHIIVPLVYSENRTVHSKEVCFSLIFLNN